jgi:uncharacterized protein YjbI with pentapeptide repeats
MAKANHLQLLRQGVGTWNARRAKELSVKPDLNRADLRGANLRGANLRGADLTDSTLTEADLHRADLNQAYLTGADLREADLSWADVYLANLRGACLSRAYLREANLGDANLTEADLNRAYLTGSRLSGANLSGANLSEADLLEANLYAARLSGANLSGANLSGADFQQASLVATDLSDADLTGCRIYGMSAWDLNLEGAKQNNLIITRRDQDEITVDNIEVAQFIYLLMHNEKIRKVIDTITTKVALILGRFVPERKQVLDALRDELRKQDLLPIIFDFSIPESRDVTETVKLLAGLARFVIADITDATEVRTELHKIIPDFPSLPVQPILLRGQPEFVSMRHLNKFPWLLPTFEYDHQEHLLVSLRDVIGPAEAKAREFRGRLT